MFGFKTWFAVGVLALAASGVSQRPTQQPKGQRPTATQEKRLQAAMKRAQVLPWSSALGRPKGNLDRATGIFVWHEGNRFHLLSAEPNRKGEAIAGVIALRGAGKIYDLDPIKGEKSDKYSLRGNRVVFRLVTAGGADGVEFSLQRGRFLMVAVRQPGAFDRAVYVGGSRLRADKPILAFDLQK